MEISQFDNATIDNSVALLVRNMTGVTFLANRYAAFMETVKAGLGRDETLDLFSLHDGERGLVLSMAVKTRASYKSPLYTKEKLLKKREDFIALFRSEDLVVGYSACDDNTCDNGMRVLFVFRQKDAFTNSFPHLQGVFAPNH